MLLDINDGQILVAIRWQWSFFYKQCNIDVFLDTLIPLLLLLSFWWNHRWQHFFFILFHIYYIIKFDLSPINLNKCHFWHFWQIPRLILQLIMTYYNMYNLSWHDITTCGAYLCPVGRIWPFLAPPGIVVTTMHFGTTWWLFIDFLPSFHPFLDTIS